MIASRLRPLLVLPVLAACGGDGTAPDGTTDRARPDVTIAAPSTGALRATDTVHVRVTGRDDQALAYLGWVLNGSSFDSVRVSGTSASRDFVIPGLVEGDNHLFGVAVDAAGNADTTSITVVSDRTAPRVTFEPAAGFTTLESSAMVRGSATDAHLVTALSFRVGGGAETAIVGASGPLRDFVVPTGTLAPGANRVTVYASDAAGNRDSASTTVTYSAARFAAAELVPLAGDLRVYAVALNDAGIVAGGSIAAGPSPDLNGPPRAVRWTNGGAPQVIAVPASSAGTIATAIASDGTIVGEEFNASQAAPFRVRGGTATSLGRPADSTTYLTASVAGVNASGTAVGSSIYYVDHWAGGKASRDRALVWRGGTTQPAFLDEGVSGAFQLNQGYAINDAGVVVGTAQFAGDETISACGYCAFRLVGTTATRLEGGNDFSGAYGLNAAGTAVGTVVVGATGRAALWPASGGRQLLAAAFAATQGDVAWAINDAGLVVGTASFPLGDEGGSEARAALWENGRVLDLNTLVPDDVPVRLTEARAINNRGQILVMGSTGGGFRAFLLTPTGVTPTR